MSLHELEDLISSILDFQANIVRVTHRKKTTPVDPENEPSHAQMLQEIWDLAKLEVEEVDEEGEPIQWRRLGFETEDLQYEFQYSGFLGLECLVSLVRLMIVNGY
jgi:engulfment and cell motility protein 1